jgi:hypothetical protein
VWRRLKRVDWREWAYVVVFTAAGGALTIGEYALGWLDWIWDVHDSPEDNGAIGLLFLLVVTQGLVLLVLTRRRWKLRSRLVTGGTIAAGTLLLLVEARAGWHDWFLAHEWGQWGRGGGIVLPLLLVWAANAVPLFVAGFLLWALVSPED